MIEGVQLHSLSIIGDERGQVLHMLKQRPDILKAIGEVYFSKIYKGYVKAWKKHLKMTQRLVVPVGDVKFVLYDDRIDSNTYKQLQYVSLGVSNYQLLILPPNIWYGFQCISDTDALIVNCPDLAHDATEVIRMDLDQNVIPHQWGVVQ